MDKTLALLIVDTVGSLATYFVTAYFSPPTAEKILYVLAGLQPIVIYVIKTWKDQAVAALAAGLDPKTLLPLKK